MDLCIYGPECFILFFFYGCGFRFHSESVEVGFGI